MAVKKEDFMDQLIENNLILQKKTTELLVTMNGLTKKIDVMVDIFTKAAGHIESGELKAPLEKQLNELLEQNKRIAHGLILLEKYVRNRETLTPKTSTQEF